MFWYVLNLFLIILVWMAPVPARCGVEDSELQIHKIRTRRTCIVGAVNWVLLSGLRAYSVGADTEAYLEFFQNARGTSWQTLWNKFSEKYFMGVDGGDKDIGYSIIEKFFRTLTSDYTLWLLFIAVIFTVPMAIYIYKYSKNACVSWIVYSTLFYSFFAITGLRQTIATAIVLWGGLEFIRKRKLIPFVILVLIAYTIHASAICLLPFYWLSRLKITRTKLVGYLAAIVGAFIFRNQLLVFLQSLVGYESYQQYEGAQAGSFMFLLLAMAVFTTLFWENISRSDNSTLNMSVNALMIACFFSPLLLINPSCMRVVQYYSLFILFLLPEYVWAFNQRSRNLFLMIICGVMIGLFVLQDPEYSFILM